MKETKDSAFSLRGEVIIKDANTGKVLVHKHNMIVNGGLSFIRWAILSRLNQIKDKNDSNSLFFNKLNSKYTDKNISLYVNFGTGVKDSYLEIEKLDKESTLEKLKDVLPEISYNDDKNRLELVISVSNETTSAQEYISELGIFLKTKSTNDNESTSGSEPDTMFSRVTFDPILFSASTPFTLTYYIYL